MNDNQKQFLHVTRHTIAKEVDEDTDVVVVLIHGDERTSGWGNTDHPRKLMSAAIDIMYRIRTKGNCNCPECVKLKAVAEATLETLKEFVTTIPATKDGETLQ